MLQGGEHPPEHVLPHLPSGEAGVGGDAIDNRVMNRWRMIISIEHRNHLLV